MPLSYPANAAWTHAGGVAYRHGDAGPEILLVRARPQPHDWVLPKGHIEEGETPPECARREVREEAGVDAEPIGYLGDNEYTTPGEKRVNVAFFLMRYVNEVPATEDRQRLWCTFAHARSLIPFDSARDIIRAAETRLTDLIASGDA